MPTPKTHQINFSRLGRGRGHGVWAGLPEARERFIGSGKGRVATWHPAIRFLSCCFFPFCFFNGWFSGWVSTESTRSQSLLAEDPGTELCQVTCHHRSVRCHSVSLSWARSLNPCCDSWCWQLPNRRSQLADGTQNSKLACRTSRILPGIIWQWVKPPIVPPANIPIPTKIGSNMGGEFTYRPKWYQNGVDNHAIFREQRPAATKTRSKAVFQFWARNAAVRRGGLKKCEASHQLRFCSWNSSFHWTGLARCLSEQGSFAYCLSSSFHWTGLAKCLSEQGSFAYCLSSSFHWTGLAKCLSEQGSFAYCLSSSFH